MKRKLHTIIAGALLGASNPTHAEETPQGIIANEIVNKTILSGKQITEGPALETFAMHFFDKFDGGVWVNYDLQKNRLAEVDVIAGKGIPISDNINAYVKGAWFHIPDFGDFANGTVEILTSYFPVDFSVVYDHILGSQTNGQQLKINAQKQFTYQDTTLTASASTAFSHNYLGTSSGHAYSSLGIGIEHTLNDPTTLSLNITKNVPHTDEHTSETQIRFGVKIQY